MKSKGKAGGKAKGSRWDAGKGRYANEGEDYGCVAQAADNAEVMTRGAAQPGPGERGA